MGGMLQITEVPFQELSMTAPWLRASGSQPSYRAGEHVHDNLSRRLSTLSMVRCSVARGASTSTKPSTLREGSLPPSESREQESLRARW